jgi:DNA-binding transcriptional ArsR family regulator
MCGEASVSEIEARTGVRQPVLSRELARLRAAGLVATRRASKLVFYRLADDRLPNIIEGLCVSCAMGRAAAKAGNSSRRTARPRRKAARNLNGGTR